MGLDCEALLRRIFWLVFVGCRCELEGRNDNLGIRDSLVLRSEPFGGPEEERDWWMKNASSMSQDDGKDYFSKSSKS